MGNILLLSGLVIFGLVLLIFAFKLKTGEPLFDGIFQLFSIGMIVVLLILLPKIVIDGQDHCSLVVENTTINGTRINYDYARFCVEDDKNTTTTFFVAVTWFLRVLISFFTIFFIYRVLTWFHQRVPRIRK